MRKPYTKNTYTASFKAEVLQQLANGASIMQVAKGFKVGSNTIYEWCFQAGMPTNRTLKDYQKAICQEYLDTEASQQEIANKHEVPIGTLRSWLAIYRKTDSNIVSSTNNERTKNYAQLVETPPEVKATTTAATFNNIDDGGKLYGIPTSKRWIEGVS